MNDKLIYEFASKLNRTKNQYESTKKQCDVLKREAIRLEKEYEKVQHEKQSAEQFESNVKSQLLSTVQFNKMESEKCSKEQSDINKLRDLKKKLSREKQIAEADMMSSSLKLQELIKDRVSLENSAKLLSDKLELVSAERMALQEELDKTNGAIDFSSKKISDLRGELESMKKFISDTCNGQIKQ